MRVADLFQLHGNFVRNAIRQKFFHFRRADFYAGEVGDGSLVTRIS